MFMKIAFIVTSFPNLSETFILNQITGLLHLGYEVEIFANSNPNQDKVHPNVEACRLMERTHYFNMPANKVKRVLKALGLLIANFHKAPGRLLRALNVFKYGRDALSLRLLYALIPFLGREQEYDIIHCHFGPNGNLGARLKQLGIQGTLVTTFHGHDTRLGIEKGGHIYQNLFEDGDCFIAVSDYNYKNLINFGLDENKIIYHPVGIDLDKFIYKWQSEPSKDTKPIKVLTIARLVEIKGLQYGIQAIRKLLEQHPELILEYNIIGDGPLKGNLEGLIQELMLGKFVHLLGPRGQKQVVQSLQQSHIFLLPSIAESFGVVLLEAQAVGLPIVATSVGGTSQAIIDGKSGFLVPERDVDALAEKLQYLIEHPELWPDMGRAGREFVEEHYDIKKLNRRLVEIYEALLAGWPKQYHMANPASTERG